MSKLTNLLIPLILISTGVISCANYGFVKRNDITDQQFVNTMNQNGNDHQGLPQLEEDSMTSQAVPASIPTKKKPLSMTNAEDRQSNNIAIDKERVDNLPGMGRSQLKLNQVGLAHLALGIAYTERDLIDQAICEFQSAIEANPHHLESYVRLGTTYRLKGMENEAQSEFKKAIDINLNEAVAKIVFSALPVTANQNVKTDIVKAHINLGDAYKENGKLKKSQLEYEKALKIKPEHPIARKSLSEIYYSAGTSCLEKSEYANAIDAFNTVLKLYPGFPQIKEALEKAHYNLGISYAENGELNKAIIEFNKTMKINLHYAMLEKNNLNTPGKGKKAVSGKQIYHNRNLPDESTNNSSNIDAKEENFHEEEVEPLQEMSHQIDFAGEMILAEKGNAKEAEYDQKQTESKHPLLSQESNKISSDTVKLQKADDSRDEMVQLKTEISNEGQRRKQIREKIAHAKSADTEGANVNGPDFMNQERGGEYAENSNTNNPFKERLTQFNQPDEDNTIIIQTNSPVVTEDDNILARNHIVSDEIKSISGHRVFSYYITRNYNSKTGFNDAIEKYEDATRKNNYDNNAFLSLAHAYYSKATHLDHAIARREEDTAEGKQNFLVQRYYLNNDVDEVICNASPTEQAKTLKDYNMTFHNKLGNMYHKREMFSKAINEYKNALKIDPDSPETLYSLAFSLSKKGSYLGVALKSRNNPKRTLTGF